MTYNLEWREYNLALSIGRLARILKIEFCYNFFIELHRGDTNTVFYIFACNYIVQSQPLTYIHTNMSLQRHTTLALGAPSKD
jgi:hypothetical protein